MGAFLQGRRIRHLYRQGQAGKYDREERIHYRMLYRNSAKAKLGQVMFINETLHDAA
ncbi:MAG: hypothetical protein ACLUOI_20275 [Eisenbergiella sp.]